MIRIGTAGWSYPDWEGVVYPKTKPKGFHPLRYLAGFFDCVELNASFYANPREDAASRWAACVEAYPHFRFTAKLGRSFTHEPLPKDDRTLHAGAEAFDRSLEGLGKSGKLAGLLVQFPLSFRCDEAALRRLARLESCFGHHRLILEVRHRSWFERAPLREIERLGYGLARIDLPSSDSHPPPDAPCLGPIAYVRLHGRNRATWFAKGVGRDQRYDYLYGKSEVEELVELVRGLTRAADETFVITNNHFAGQAVANALEIKAGLNEEKPAAPVELIARYPRLSGITRPHGQPDLFA